MASIPTNVIWVSTSGRANSAGTAADPYGSIQDAIDHAVPGTAIMVKAGVYTENLRISNSGTADAPIQIISVDGSGAAEIRPASQTNDTIEISRADYVTIDGLKVAGPTSSSANAINIHAHSGVGVFDPATNVVVQNCSITAGNGDGIKVSKAEYISLLNNTIVGSAGIEEGIDAVGVHHLVIANNSVSSSGGIGIAVKGGSYDVLVEANHVDGTANHGIGVGGYTEEAYFWPGFIGSQSYEVKDIRVVGNEIENSSHQGIRVIAAQNAEISGNLIHDVSHQYAVGVSSAGGAFHSPAWASQNIEFDHNSFDKIDWLRVENGQTNITSENNLTSGGLPSGWEDAGPEATMPISYFYATATSIQLQSGSTILHVVAADPGAATAINLTGNALSQTIEGNAGRNILDGKGGIDALYGYRGDDTYYVDHVLDTAYERSGEGFDTVFTSVSYGLTAGQSVERLATTLETGTQSINLTGNEVAQTLNGNAGSNILDGKGGADALYGLTGDDTYFVDDGGDLVYEDANAGFDSVMTSTSYQLAAGQHIERLATASPSGTGGVKLTGNEFGQQVIGNSGSNIISGKQGNDTLTGGLGSDTFVFDTALSATSNLDTITDFSVIDDTIRLENDIFKALGKAGALSVASFHTGSAAADADDRIIYHSSTGNLFYDADGNGSGAAVQFAKLASGLSLTASDFLIV